MPTLPYALQDKWVPAAEHGYLSNMHQSSVEGCDDMIGLGDLHEGAILHNLSIRYKDPTMCNIYVSARAASQPCTRN